MEIAPEVVSTYEWDALSNEAKDLSVYLASLNPMKTHSDPDTLMAFLGFDEEKLTSALNQLRDKQVLDETTFRRELEKVIRGESSDIAPRGQTWTPEQAKRILEFAPEDTVLDDPQYSLKPKYEEYVKNQFFTETPNREVK